jgi:hypothetical protein
MTDNVTSVVFSQHHPADFQPWSSSALPPRSFAKLDARDMSLNGQWRSRLSANVGPIDFDNCGFDGTTWTGITVPSNWVLERHGKPLTTEQEMGLCSLNVLLSAKLA